MALSSLRTELNGKVSVLVLTKEMLNECGATIEDCDGLVEEARGIEGTVIAVLLRELDDGWKISLRSKIGKYDVNSIAMLFGGGGHKNAAGFKTSGSITEIESAVIAEIAKLFHTHR